MLALDDGSVCFSSSEGGHTLTSAGGESVSHYYAISCYNPGDKLPHFLGSAAGMPGGMIDIGGGHIVSLSPDKNPENAISAVFSRNGDFVKYLMPNDNEDYYVDPTNGKSWSIMTPQKKGDWAFGDDGNIYLSNRAYLMYGIVRFDPNTGAGQLLRVIIRYMLAWECFRACQRGIVWLCNMILMTSQTELARLSKGLAVSFMHTMRRCLLIKMAQ